MRIEMKYIGVPLAGMTNIRRTVILPEGSAIDALIQNLIDESPGTSWDNFKSVTSVSYTHLTLPTNREV